jgi:hypothetical protein
LLAVGLGAAVFALHPSRAEAVSWISGSTELWMCALVLLAALAFDSNRNWLAGILMASELFARESAIVALRAYESNAPFDLAALARQRANYRELPPCVMMPLPIDLGRLGQGHRSEHRAVGRR